MAAESPLTKATPTRGSTGGARGGGRTQGRRGDEGVVMIARGKEIIGTQFVEEVLSRQLLVERRKLCVC